ncbi:related to pisatin demethylase cytochrome P450 [Rhynchosporium agropyri]|uniref:Related to pisatin demethylase cytochrome P450 n=1 Tax=Rhynchosporium agropyri TaxID=914238 RepID=A0A1E1KPI2_9HELO|nr:related to pisatin demethylase cytochrome P450 [Rhynchosporium agropyri]
MDRSTILVTAAAVLAHSIVSPIHEVSTVKILVAYSTASAFLFGFLIVSSQQLTYSVACFSILNFDFLLVTTLLTLIRRFYFSPLSHFPGSKLAALSNAYLANEFRTGRGSRTLVELHKKYKSDFIRIGPNQLSINKVEAVEAIFRGKYPRGSFYEVGALNGELNLNSQRDYSVHTPWRRIWERAFASSEFQHYNPRVEYHVTDLVEVIKKANNEEVDCTRVMDNLAFDIMADLSFAYESKLQSGTGDNHYMHFIHKFMSAVGVISTFRNVCQLLIYLPETADVKEYRIRGESLLSGRQRLGNTRRDIFSHLLSTDNETSRNIKFTQAKLNANAQLIIVAGSDTASTTLTQTFRILAKQSSTLKKLQAEVDACASKGALTVDGTRNLPYLNAIINFNPVPMGAYAASPPLGVYVAETFIPGNVQINVPPGAVMTDPRYFEKPEEYIPERWEEWSEGVKDRRAFFPFGYGVHSCVERQLALNELRMVLATVVQRWDVVLGEQYSEEKWKLDWKDHALLEIGELWVKFVPRISQVVNTVGLRQ